MEDGNARAPNVTLCTASAKGDGAGTRPITPATCGGQVTLCSLTLTFSCTRPFSSQALPLAVGVQKKEKQSPCNHCVS